MKIQVKPISLAVLAAFFISCTSTRNVPQSPSDLEGMQHITLDTMSVYPDVDPSDIGDVKPLPAYKPSRERYWDLLHTKLDLSFDWPNEAVIGTATLTLTPVFYSQSNLRLDAVGFVIHEIAVGDRKIQDYHYDGEEITISLPSLYTKENELTIRIDYTARPRPSRQEEGAVITSDQGLFFIDPLDTIPGLPRQIWTQGETSYNRKWFPTLDQPNERGTQEIMLTVADTLMTLSNGLLVSSTPLASGMRRDHWKLDLPHAPYLAMIAVGQWDKETDYWRGRPVDYYVDQGYGASARAIFAHTTEMLDFFSKRLGYDYVWPKYAQIIVKNFVSGAMENTTAVVYGDFIQFHQDDVLEVGVNDYIVAHELFHHWFGNLVTCESWANLTLNEGFANYAEYLWQEYKYGRERADISRLNELSGYYDQAANEVFPLIRYHYDRENEMFDAHSYNKGGLVLHMLRDIVGDDAFFAALRLYLQQHAYAAAEVHDLRQAFEEVTGKDFNWFFDQWYFGVGHPVLQVRQEYDLEQKRVTLDITQDQAAQGYTDVFQLPVEIAIYHQDGTIEVQEILLTEKEQHFSFDARYKPMTVVVDPRDILLAVVEHQVPEDEYVTRLLSQELSISHRISAFRLIDDIEPEVLRQVMEDSSFTMSALIIGYLADRGDAERLYELSLREAHPEIRYYILQTLMEVDPWKSREIAMDLLEKSDKVPIIYAALQAIAAVDMDEAVHQASHFKDHPADALLAARASILAQRKNLLSLEFFSTDRAAHIKDEYLEELVSAMALYLSGQPSSEQTRGMELIDSEFFLRTPDPQYRRFYLITGLLRQFVKEEDEFFQDKLLAMINSLYTKEPSGYLRGVLKDGLGDLLD